MNKVVKTKIENADRFYLKNKLWGYDDYDAPVYVQLVYDDEYFTVRFTVEESDPLCEKKNHFEWVHEDSCVEFFVNFTPEQSNKYINFEVNAAGIMNVAIRTDRYDGIPLTLEEVQNLQIHPEIQEDKWIVTYKISYELIKKYFPEFDIQTCNYIYANFYKCGEHTKLVHFVSFYKVETPTPDFHRPEYFGKIELEK